MIRAHVERPTGARSARPDAGRLALGIPPTVSASDPNGTNQVGCLYTAQGLEFDYVGVNFGRNLHWDTASDAKSATRATPTTPSSNAPATLRAC